MTISSTDNTATADVARDEHVVVFRLADELYAVAIETVQEIVRMQPVTPIPGGSDGVEGITNLRGSVVPVMDLRHRCGLPAVERGNETRIIVVDTERGMAGIVVDSVSEVIRIPAADVEPSAGLVGRQDEPLFRGVAKLADRLILLIDLDHLFHAAPAVPERREIEAEAA